MVAGVMTMPDGKEICQDTVDGRREYRERTRAMVIRQHFRDAITNENMETWEATFDHEAGRCGGKRDDRIEVDGEWRNAALLWATNGLKGSKRYHWSDGKYVPKAGLQ